MNTRTYIMSLAVVLAGLTVFWLVRTRTLHVETSSLKRSPAPSSQFPSSISSNTLAAPIGQPHKTVATNTLVAPIAEAKAGASLSNLKVLNDRNASTQSRAVAADALGLSRSSNAVASLIIIVGDQTENIILRYKAARALGSIGDATAVPVLSDLLLSAAVDKHLRFVSALALGSLASPDAVRALSAAAHDNDSLLRLKAIQALMRTHVNAAAAPAFGAINDSDADVQAEAIRAYGALAGRASITAITDKLSSTDSAFIKIACLTALGEAGGPEAEVILTEYTNSSNDLLRINAARALQRAKGNQQ